MQPNSQRINFFSFLSIPLFFISLNLITLIFSLDAFFLKNQNHLVLGIILYVSSFFLLLDFSRKKLSPNKFLSIIVITLFFNLFLVFKTITIRGGLTYSLKGESFYGQVEKVTPKRYNQQVEIKFAKTLKDLNNLEKTNKGLTFLDLNQKIKPQDLIHFKAKLKQTTNSKKSSPFLTFLNRKGINYVINIKKNCLRTITTNPPSLKEKVKMAIAGQLDLLFAPSTSGLLKALYFGDKNYLSKKMLTSFKKAGVLHTLAASGLHVGLLSLLPFFILSLFKIDKRIIYLVTLGLISFYLYITGAPVSLQRASLMFGFYTLQKIFFLDQNIFNTLFLTAITILLIYPFELFSLGFQLSFGATFGILFFFKSYQKTFSYLPSFIQNSLTLTFSAQIMVLPIIFFTLKEVNLSGFLSNIVVVPLVGLILISSIIINLFALLSVPIGKVLAQGTDLLFYLNKSIVQAASSLGGHFLIEKNSFMVMLLFLLLLAPLLPIPQKKRLSLVVLVGIIFSWGFLHYTYANPKNKIKYFYNQGQVLSVRQEGRQTILQGELISYSTTQKVIKFLHKQARGNLILYLDKPNYKNIKNFSYIIKKFLISSCHLPYKPTKSLYGKRFLNLLEKDDITLIVDQK